MGRMRRPNLPGVPFHITARVQGRAPLLVGIEGTVVRLAREQVARSGGELLAYAIMPNHLHLVYVQGDRSLSSYMQPLLRRIALRVHARERTEGHVFERPFRAQPCRDPDYLRNAILYVHLNPVRAQLCAWPGQYRWTSHRAYRPVEDLPLDWSGTPASSLRLFAPTPGCTAADLHRNYLAFIRWRVETDRARVATAAGELPSFPTPPCYAGGDAYWIERFSAASTRRMAGTPSLGPSIDLRDLALRVLREMEPDMPIDLFRSGRRLRAVIPVRRQFIQRAKENGHRNRSIARFLNVSDVLVSATR